MSGNCRFCLLSGVVAGILNVLAGGGSLLTLPHVDFSRPADGRGQRDESHSDFLPEYLCHSRLSHKRGMLPLKLALLCTPPALLGSWLGANLAISLDDQVFKRVLALIMIGVLVFTAVDPMKRFRRARTSSSASGATWWLSSPFSASAFYGGFVQAGVGFLVITALLVHGPRPGQDQRDQGLCYLRLHLYRPGRIYLSRPDQLSPGFCPGGGGIRSAA